MAYGKSFGFTCSMRIEGPIWRRDCLRLPKHMLERRVRRGSCCGATRGSTARIGFMRRAAIVRHGPIHVLHDISNSLEFGYAKPISGIELLDTAAAASAERRLAEILRACVDAGASVSYLPPLALECRRGLLAAHGCRCRCRHADPARCLGQRRAGRSRDAGIRVVAQSAASRRGAEAARASRRTSIWRGTSR